MSIGSTVVVALAVFVASVYSIADQPIHLPNGTLRAEPSLPGDPGWLRLILGGSVAPGNRPISGGNPGFSRMGGAGIGPRFNNGLRNGWDGNPSRSGSSGTRWIELVANQADLQDQPPVQIEPALPFEPSRPADPAVVSNLPDVSLPDFSALLRTPVISFENGQSPGSLQGRNDNVHPTRLAPERPLFPPRRHTVPGVHNSWPRDQHVAAIHQQTPTFPSQLNHNSVHQPTRRIVSPSVIVGTGLRPTIIRPVSGSGSHQAGNLVGDLTRLVNRVYGQDSRRRRIQSQFHVPHTNPANFPQTVVQPPEMRRTVLLPRNVVEQKNAHQNMKSVIHPNPVVGSHSSLLPKNTLHHPKSESVVTSSHGFPPKIPVHHPKSVVPPSQGYPPKMPVHHPKSVVPPSHGLPPKMPVHHPKSVVPPSHGLPPKMPVHHPKSVVPPSHGLPPKIPVHHPKSVVPPSQGYPPKMPVHHPKSVVPPSHGLPPKMPVHHPKSVVPPSHGLPPKMPEHHPKSVVPPSQGYPPKMPVHHQKSVVPPSQGYPPKMPVHHPKSVVPPSHGLPPKMPVHHPKSVVPPSHGLPPKMPVHHPKSVVPPSHGLPPKMPVNHLKSVVPPSHGLPPKMPVNHLKSVVPPKTAIDHPKLSVESHGYPGQKPLVHPKPFVEPKNIAPEIYPKPAIHPEEVPKKIPVDTYSRRRMRPRGRY